MKNIIIVLGLILAVPTGVVLGVQTSKLGKKAQKQTQNKKNQFVLKPKSNSPNPCVSTAAITNITATTFLTADWEYTCTGSNPGYSCKFVVYITLYVWNIGTQDWDVYEYFQPDTTSSLCGNNGTTTSSMFIPNDLPVGFYAAQFQIWTGGTSSIPYLLDEDEIEFTWIKGGIFL